MFDWNQVFWLSVVAFGGPTVGLLIIMKLSGAFDNRYK